MANSVNESVTDITASATNLITSIKTIVDLIKGIFTPSTPLPNISKLQIGMGMGFREGLSKMDIWSASVDKQAKIGIPIANLPSGAKNNYIAKDKIIIDELINNIHEKAKVEIIIPVNEILVSVRGVTSNGGTFTTMGVNDIPQIGVSKGEGIIR